MKEAVVFAAIELDQWCELLEDRQVAVAQLLRREPVRVYREQRVEPAEFLPRGMEYSLQRFRGFTALRLRVLCRPAGRGDRAKPALDLIARLDGPAA